MTSLSWWLAGQRRGDSVRVLALFGVIGLVWFGCAPAAPPGPKTPSPNDKRLSEERNPPKDDPAPKEPTAPSIVAPPPGYGNTIVRRRKTAPDEPRSRDR